MLLIRADDAFFGTISMINFATSLLQLLTPFLMERVRERKRLIVTLRSIVHITNVVLIGLIPYSPLDVRGRLLMVAVFSFTINMLNAIVSPAMSVWHIGHVAQNVRVAYFSTAAVINGVVIAVMNLSSSFVVDLFRMWGRELQGLTVLRVLAVAMAVVDISILLRIRELPDAHPPKKINLIEFFKRPWQEKTYLRTVLIVILWSVANNLPGSYYSVYLLKELGVSYSYITLVSLANVLILTLVTPVWRRFYQKYSWLRPLSCAVALHAAHLVVLSFVSSKTLFLYPVGMVMAFTTSAGINLGFSSVPFLNLPEENQTLFVGFYSTMGSLGSLLSATLSRAYIRANQKLRFRLLQIDFGEKQLLMLLAACAMLIISASIYVIYRRNRREGSQA